MTTTNKIRAALKKANMTSWKGRSDSGYILTTRNDEVEIGYACRTSNRAERMAAVADALKTAGISFKIRGHQIQISLAA
jgi:hypothetical protein